jgi:hypothetical protein
MVGFRVGAFGADVAFRPAGRDAGCALRAAFFVRLVALAAVGGTAFFLAMGGSFRLLDSWR